MSIFLIILAAGESKRLKTSKPKPYIVIGNKTLVENTINKFNKIKTIKKIVLTYNKKHKKILDRLKIKNVIKVCGGKTRAQSTFFALKKIKNLNCSKVLIHDVARPNASVKLIKKIIDSLKLYKAVIPYIKSKDSIKFKKQKNSLLNMNRKKIIMTQTPQGFDYKKIINLHYLNKNMDISDDASLFVEKNQKLNLIKGEETNIKITNLHDLNLLRKLKEKNLFYGIGFDIHKLVVNKKLYIGGVNIPFHSGLEGHSDGDPVIHALIDSILGASKLGDIGTLFPNNNPKYKNIKSIILLDKVINLISSRNFYINNIDINIITQKPHLSKYKSKMINLLCKKCKIKKDQINIKGKTTEKLGIIGKEKAIASEVITSLILNNE